MKTCFHCHEEIGNFHSDTINVGGLDCDFHDDPDEGKDCVNGFWESVRKLEQQVQLVLRSVEVVGHSYMSYMHR